jgi:2-hydroxychromene-2-carboxylate isomerase
MSTSLKRSAGRRAGIGPYDLMAKLAKPGPGSEAQAALSEFERLGCPGVPTVVVNGQRYFGKDRVDWVVETCRAGAGHA